METIHTSQRNSTLPPQKEKEGTQAESEVSNSTTFLLQYRGRETDNLSRQLKKISTINIDSVLTLRKLKSTLPSLKPLVPKPLRSHLVYQIECPGCQASYVGYTKRHVSARLREHRNVKAPVGKHFANCVGIKPEMMNDLRILQTTTRSEKFLQALEALHINEIQPGLNTRDEYQSRTLTLKI